MADEPVTVETNSTPAIQTDAADQTATPTSTTEASNPTSESQPTSEVADASDTATDPLDAAGLLGDDAAASDPADADADDGTDDDGDSGDQGDDAVVLHGAPEGDYEIELPEGMTLDKGALDEIAPLARELNLSNAGLSKLATEALPVAQKLFDRSMLESVLEVRRDYEADSRAYVQGGKLSDGTEITASSVFKGENMDAVTTTGARALDRFTSDEGGNPILFPGAKVDAEGNKVPGTFRDFLKSTGLGLHPAMIHFAYRAGQAISEDNGFERSGDTPQSKLTREEKYFPHLTQA